MTTYARAWARLGLLSRRLDLAGIGDSDGDPAEDETPAEYEEAWYLKPSFVAETEEALQWLTAERGAQRFDLVGLCSGALWGYQAAMAHEHVAGVALLNPRFPGGSRSSGARAPLRLPRSRCRLNGTMTGAVKLEPVESFDAVRDELGPLAERSGNVFATPEWLETWWRHFGNGEPMVTVCRDGDTLVAVLPLYRVRIGPLRLVRFVGHGPGDQLGPVCAPADCPHAAEALRNVLAQTRFDAFLGEELPGSVDWGLPGRVLVRRGSPVIHLHGATWDEYLASRSSHFRGGVRRRERKLFREHDARFRLSDPDHLEADLDSLFALHSMRWRGFDSAFERARAFHFAFAAIARDCGWLRLWLLEIEGRAVAAWYGFRFGGSESFYQAGRDPAWAQYRVGSVLLAHAVRAACQDGMDEFRFLRGDEEYKYNFATGDEGLVTVAVPRGLRGEIVLRAASRLRR